MSYPPPHLDRDRLDQLIEMAKRDQIRKKLLDQLADGRYHSTSMLTRNLKYLDPSIGIVRVATILDEFQSLLGEEMLQKNPTSDVAEWRVNPAYIDFLQEVIKKTEGFFE